MHPNTITFFSLITGCLAGAAYWATDHSPFFYFVGAAMVVISGLADCFDGIVARKYGKTSALGDFLDHFFDRIVNMAILGGLAFSPHASPPLGLAVAILILLNSYLGTQIETSFGARDYTGLGKAQLFVALILVSIGLGVHPDASLTIAGHTWTAINVFFAIISLATLQAMCHRLRLAVRLSGAEPKDEAPSRQ